MRAGARLAPRQRVDLALDRAAQQPVPARVVVDAVDPVPVAVVRQQPRRVALGAAAVLLRLGRARDGAAVAHAVDRPAGALALQALPQREVGVEEVDVLERRRLVEDLVRPCVRASMRPVSRIGTDAAVDERCRWSSAPAGRRASTRTRPCCCSASSGGSGSATCPTGSRTRG